ncbi:MAG: NHL repeat-containing protein [Terrimicrobiaceae bacterium]|nr:NHL repeat-containing protein [Terrimicrobiaceae bacterium]
MKKSLRFFALMGSALAGICPQLPAASFSTFQAADLVLGQTNFTSGGFLTPPTGASLRAPSGIAIDPATGKVFVADAFNNRVLRFSSAAAMASGSNAEAVFGQPNFSGSSPNQGGSVSASTLAVPTTLAIDGNGTLWVADGNNRVVGYLVASSLSNNPPADRVLGQATFTTAAPGLTASTLKTPSGAWADSAGNLWVADGGNHRVLRYDNVAAKANGAAADGVLGQANFTSGAAATSASGMSPPGGVHVDGSGTLWVADTGNRRVLRFANAAARIDGAPADGVLGQADFASTAPSTTQAGMSGPVGVLTDAHGSLYVSDSSNNRVLIFDGANGLANGAPADVVLGQPDFTTSAPATAAQGMNGPGGSALDSAGRLWVTDGTNSRALRFSPIVSPAPGKPKLTIAGKKTITTGKPSVRIRGTASSSVGIARVEFKVGTGSFKTAQGTASWKFKTSITSPATIIKIRAIDTTGRFSKVGKVKVILE